MNRNHFYSLRLFAALCLLVSGLCSAQSVAQAQPAGESKAVFGRVAILSSSSTPQALEDLVFAELSERGCELVARAELLGLMTEEIKTQELSTNVGMRIRAGALTRADVLLLLDDTIDADGQATKVTLLETNHGVRLADAIVDKEIEEAAKFIGDFAERTRERFRGGISAMVAIPPFLSKNVSYAFDDLQTSISLFLGEQLRTTPGVVIVEFERAQDILEEMAFAEEIDVRLLPKIVKGSFRVQEPALTEVQLDVEISTPKKTDRVEGSIALADLHRWLRSTVVPMLIDSEPALQADDAPFSAEEQFSSFSERADKFAELGDFARSTQLREAALVVSPGNVEQRFQLIREYRSLIESYRLYVRTPEDVIPSEPARRKLKRKYGDSVTRIEEHSKRYMQHAEWLLRNGQVQDRFHFRKVVRNFGGVAGLNSKEFESEYARFAVAAATQWKSLPRAKTSTSELNSLALANEIDPQHWWVTAPRSLLKNYWGSLNPSLLEAPCWVT